MESYFEALNYYEKNRESDYLWEMMEEYSQMEKGVIKCIVFSAMCVESFLNDYAAMRMGDSDFYDNFDKLKPIGKFQLIANFVLKSEFDKSKSYYSLLKDLFRLRNGFVHNKSQEADIFGFSSLEEAEAFQKESMASADFLKMSESDRKEVDLDIKNAMNSLRAVYELAKYFEENNCGYSAVEELFNTHGVIYGSEREKEYKKYVFSKLNIKINERYLV
jgi:hypothetical protein